MHVTALKLKKIAEVTLVNFASLLLLQTVFTEKTMSTDNYSAPTAEDVNPIRKFTIITGVFFSDTTSHQDLLQHLLLQTYGV